MSCCAVDMFVVGGPFSGRKKDRKICAVSINLSPVTGHATQFIPSRATRRRRRATNVYPLFTNPNNLAISSFLPYSSSRPLRSDREKKERKHLGCPSLDDGLTARKAPTMSVQSPSKCLLRGFRGLRTRNCPRRRRC